jgi:GT2 family glycosyltransferase
MEYSHELKKLSIIIPSMQLKRSKNPKHFYRSISSLPDLVESIKKNVSIDLEVIVVANGLNDRKLIEYIEVGNVDKYCINNHNVGVSRAWNMGRQLAEGEYLLFINDDVTIGEQAVEILMKTLEQEEDVGVVGPKGAMWKNVEFTEHVGLTKPAYADVILGFCFMVRSSDFDMAGGVDVNYTPAGMEEIDFCYSMRKIGFKIKVIPGLNIFTEPRHGISARNTTVKYFNSEVNTKDLHERNKVYFKNKWGDLA